MHSLPFDVHQAKQTSPVSVLVGQQDFSITVLVNENNGFTSSVLLFLFKLAGFKYCVQLDLHICPVNIAIKML